jgi:membrane dipeptidase
MGALRDAGYDDAAVAKITHGNWLRVLAATWR